MDNGNRVDEIIKRRKASTPGPWEIELYQRRGSITPNLHIRQPKGASQYGICEIFGEPDGEDPHVRADAEFIANAQQDIDYLLAEVQRLRDQNDDLEESLRGFHSQMTAI